MVEYITSLFKRLFTLRLTKVKAGAVSKLLSIFGLGKLLCSSVSNVVNGKIIAKRSQCRSSTVPEDSKTNDPSVSVGNVGQLSADLLISSIPCTHSGYIWHDALLPLVGNNPYSEQSNKIALGAEVYHNQQKKVVIVQIRSAPIKEEKKDFFDQLISWIKESKISQVIILTGSLQHERNDSQINSIPFRYVACAKTTEKHSVFKNPNWIPLETRHFPSAPQSDNESPGRCIIPGGGYAKRLYEGIVEANIPCAVIIKFTGEGDNIPDAVLLTEQLISWIPLVPLRPGSNNSIQYVYPVSWRLLFGNGPPDGLY